MVWTQTAKFVFCTPKNNACLGRKIIPIQSYRRVILGRIYLYFSSDNRAIRAQTIVSIFIFTRCAHIEFYLYICVPRACLRANRARNIFRAHDKLSSLGPKKCIKNITRICKKAVTAHLTIFTTTLLINL